MSDDNILKLPLEKSYLQNRINRLSEELANSEVDYIEPILVALINYMQECDQIDSDLAFYECYKSLHQALYWYCQFSHDEL